MIDVKKKEGESNEALLRRFSRKVQSSGVLLRVKKGRFLQKTKSKNLLREQAIRRTLVREQKDYLRRIGKLEETTDRFGRTKSKTKIHLKRR
ncbi:MAG: hypothetical protein A3F54_04860 [Candidatus Kerfeldbacteria bacterium RIFCSPHIGHO2_12_FULL_48_17]|uniref:30S ribosomal protein S21 n=1 Tax=Candidatus Kerfeldbacteria bacterium RIFCSPHIGHO2_12_FULL_48_17 TaxID=1798542 RepID=A0A1G2B4P6_9BACT|nr:MAG: hypothetical protein A3F54_04860 [Candidatus Kerfeldbacteria bacterium RIFCSPHIGHO2_12_FULL_48_17]